MKTQKRPIVIGNWKMHTMHTEGLALANTIEKQGPYPADVVICPPFTALSTIGCSLKYCQLGAQNMHAASQGAYTGEVSGSMLKALGVQYVIIGHSERRQLFFETDSCIHEKIQSALDFGLIPIVCVGETLQERNEKKTFSVIKNQLQKALNGINNPVSIHIAYEPIWAIGSGLAATPEIAEQVHMYIREYISQLYTPSFSQSLRILYGGSVKANNVEELFKQPNVDGFLVGGASLVAEEFINIINSTHL